MRLKIAFLAVLAVVVVAVVPMGAAATPSADQDVAQMARRSSPPNVVGLKLPVASERLRAAGWIPKPFNTDTLFGIVVPSHYTVCHQYKPIGKKVRLLAQKYGC